MAKPTRRPARNPFRDSYTELPYRPYALAIGQVVLSWNDLCAVLAGLFWTVMGGGYSDIPLAAWNAHPSDRAQRLMLRAAVNAYFGVYAPSHATAADDLDWLLVEAGKLEDIRNNVIHAPLASAGAGKNTIILPASVMGSPRAKRLDKLLTERKSLLAEFRWCRDTAIVLRDYGWRMDWVLSEQRGSWPERPRLPVRQSPGADRRRRGNRESPSSPPQPSQK